jgi:hypothetical protein
MLLLALHIHVTPYFSNFKMHASIFSTAAIMVLLAQAGAAQVGISNNTATLKASSFVGTSTANSYPPTGSK